MPPVLDLQNPQNWNSIYESGVLRVSRVGSGWIPIPAFDIPVICQHHILFCTAESQLAKQFWWLGIRLQMLIDVPGTPFEVIQADKINIPVNRGFLARFPQLTDQFRLRVEVPPWHEEISIRLWEYTGSSADSTEDLIITTAQGIEADLLRIEEKVDQL